MKTIADINEIRDKMQSQVIIRDNPEEQEVRIVVAMGTCGLNAGARDTFNSFVEEVAQRRMKHVNVSRVGCLGMCDKEPVVEVSIPGKEKVTYVHVDAKKAKEIVEKHVIGGSVVENYVLNK